MLFFHDTLSLQVQSEDEQRDVIGLNPGEGRVPGPPWAAEMTFALCWDTKGVHVYVDSQEHFGVCSAGAKIRLDTRHFSFSLTTSKKKKNPLTPTDMYSP